MGIESKYEYIYYTVIETEQWRRGNEDIWGTDGFTWAKAIDFINHKVKKTEYVALFGKDNEVTEVKH